jgi:threonine/homoserine/homoserine lactone efflux protein
MVDASTAAAFAAVVLGLFLIPGPAVLLTLARASSGGRQVGLATGLGISTGDAIHSVMATFGLSAVLMTSALAFGIVKFAGAGYLVFLGIKSLLEKTDDLQVDAAPSISAARAYRQGVLTELLNPKTALFFLAFFPQFVHPARGLVIGQFAVLGFLFVAMSVVYISLVAMAAGHLAGWLRRHSRIGRWQGRFVGAIYLALGAKLALQER